MTKTAIIFPGQGGQFVGQGRDWAENNPKVKALFQMADDLAGQPISTLCFKGPLEELSQTKILQPAVLAVSLAAYRLMTPEQTPDFAAGHSLGEFGALCAAEVFDEETALRLVIKRAVLMAEAAVKRPGNMMAVIGMPLDELEGVCELARNEGLIVMANFNTPEQVVISGESRAVSAAGKYIKLKKGRALPLPLSGAFHSPLMEEARAAFAEDIEKVSFKPPIFPVIPNSSGQPLDDPRALKEALKAQMVSPVYWTKTVNSLVSAGVSAFVEAWPKAYLGNLVKKCLSPGDPVEVSFQA